MTDTKMTKKDYFNELLNIKEVANNEELKGFILHELELLAKRKSGGSGKPTQKQIENEKLIEKIYEEMVPEKEYLNKEMLKELPSCTTLSGQKLNALLMKMIENGKVARVEKKRMAYFTKVVNEIDKERTKDSETN